MRQKWWAVAGLCAAAILASNGAARACVGDCSGDGTVSVAELVIGVRIDLGEAALADCPAFDVNGDAMVSIAELVAAVSAALDGCPPSPTATSFATASDTATATSTAPPTATVTPTASVTLTPTVPDVSGRWREDPLAVTASTCVALITQSFAAELAAQPACEQSITVSAPPAARLVDCTGTQVDGTIAADGTLDFAYPTTSTTTNGCTVALTAALIVPAAVTPATASYHFAIAFSDACPLADCTIDAQAMWTREAAAAEVTGRAGSSAAPPR